MLPVLDREPHRLARTPGGSGDAPLASAVVEEVATEEADRAQDRPLRARLKVLGERGPQGAARFLEVEGRAVRRLAAVVLQLRVVRDYRRQECLKLTVAVTGVLGHVEATADIEVPAAQVALQPCMSSNRGSERGHTETSEVSRQSFG